jgi:hypothetical protein
MSKINLDYANPALLSLIEDFRQILPLDTNILIPPDRSRELKGSKQPPLTFDLYSKYFLDPLMLTFPYLAIHEAVYEECVDPAVYRYVTEKIQKQFILLLKDSDLTPEEEAVRYTFERSIAPWTRYDPDLNRGEDKGEVKSLAHIATKGWIYFCSRDAKALRLIDEAHILQTNLVEQMSVRMHEVIYYLFRMKMASHPPFLKGLYKYLYRLTEHEKHINPEWASFVQRMDELYGEVIRKAEKQGPIRVS